MTEDRQPAFERRDGLLGMHRARRRDHDAVKLCRQQFVERQAALRTGREPDGLPRHVRLRVGHRRNIGYIRPGNRFKAVATNPADAEEAEPRALHFRLLNDLAHTVTSAFRNPSGRFRMASSAPASWSRPKVCV